MIELVEVQEEDKSVLRQLMELYAYDFSEYDQADVNQHGFYGYTYFEHYWTEERRHPYFIKVDGQFAGFVFVGDYCYVLENENARSISEFFVMRKYRRQGVGRLIARRVFDRFPGEWEVNQHGQNGPSRIFWEGIIDEYTQGDFRKADLETEDWTGQALLFDNSK